MGKVRSETRAKKCVRLAERAEETGPSHESEPRNPQLALSKLWTQRWVRLCGCGPRCRESLHVHPQGLRGGAHDEYEEAYPPQAAIALLASRGRRGRREWHGRRRWRRGWRGAIDGEAERQGRRRHVRWRWCKAGGHGGGGGERSNSKQSIFISSISFWFCTLALAAAASAFKFCSTLLL